MADISAGQRVGEVTVSHTRRIEAQCYRLHESPPLGALVRVGSPPMFALVSEIWNEPMDPSRPLAPRGEGLETEDEIYAANPQLSTMLTTRFTANIVGFDSGSARRWGLPERPPNLHAFVALCDGEEINEFAGDLGWLRLLLTDGSPVGDAAVAGFLRRSAELSPNRKAFLLRAGRALTEELANDAGRLQSVLRELAQ